MLLVATSVLSAPVVAAVVVVVAVVAVVPVAEVSVVAVDVIVWAVAAVAVIVPVVPVVAVSVPLVEEAVVSVEVAEVSLAGSFFLQPKANMATATRASRVARVIFFICKILLIFRSRDLFLSNGFFPGIRNLPDSFSSGVPKSPLFAVAFETRLEIGR